MASAGYLKAKATHYPEQSFGAGRYGPLGIENVVEFSRELAKAVAAASANENVTVVCSDLPWAVTNTLLLLGAYLILEVGFRLDRVAEVFPKGALAEKFPLPWRQTPLTDVSSLTLGDCLRGLDCAERIGWLNYRSFDGQGHCKTLKSYDATELFHVTLSGGESTTTSPTNSTASPTKAWRRPRLSFWAVADPVTTVADPRVRPEPPRGGFVADYEELLLNENGKSSWARGISVDATFPKVTGSCSSDPPGGNAFYSSEPEPAHVDRFSDPEPNSARISLDLDSIRENDPRAAETEWPSMPKDGSWLEQARARRFGHLHHQKHSPVPFAHLKERGLITMPEFAMWLRGVKCRRLVQLNFPNEKNLPPGGSYANYFSAWGVEQHALQFADGTMPPKEVVRRFCELVERLELDMQADGTTECSVVVHCTAGLGRTVTLLGAVAAQQGMDGGAWLGWSRMCRPGSVQTLEQERFLRKLRVSRSKSSQNKCCAQFARLFRT